MRRLGGIAVCLALIAAACGNGDGGVEVSDARIGQPTGPNAAMYFVATSGDGDVLTGASTDAAAAIEVHETTMGDDGTMGMSAVERLEVPAGGELVLEPGGYHLMLIDAERMEVGDKVSVVLEWQNAGEMTVEAEVVEPADTMGHEDH